MILSINLPEFTQIVLLMNWRNKSCKFVKKIVESISKRINCKRDTPHKLRSTLLIGHSTTNLQVDKIWHFRDSSCQHSFILGLLYNDHFDKVGAQGDWCNQLKLQNLIKFVSSGLYIPIQINSRNSWQKLHPFDDFWHNWRTTTFVCSSQTSKGKAWGNLGLKLLILCELNN